ncbi:PP2C family serine/threonine-protein phosphatase [Pseudonocardia sp. CA-107938]|uniref:PP2C family serine/threonine-protein phosphatase n=1 Tax=Pseudonocardia sp. CA-107938 TaxID=3240021 RepID=UPI003D945DC8
MTTEVTTDVTQTCPHCGEQVGPSDQFCENCGGGLRVLRGATADHVGAASTVCRSCGREVDALDPDEPGDQYCPDCGALRDDGTDHIDIDLGTIAGVSDRGLLHARNEDAMALGIRAATTSAPAVLAAVVCDGVSSVDRPQLASRAATASALDVLLTERNPDVTATAHIQTAVSAAAQAIAGLPYDSGRGAPSCTLVAALVEGTEFADITVAWVGDSRAYWLTAPGGEERSTVLTTDHSWAVEIVALGELDEATAAADPRAHAITRWMGADASDAPSVTQLRPAGPGVLLLCSDGLWNYLPEAADLASAAFAAGATPYEMATELTQYALDSGGRDNITVVALPVVPGTDSGVENSTAETSPVRNGVGHGGGEQ